MRYVMPSIPTPKSSLPRLISGGKTGMPSDLFYLLLVGTGVGVRCSKDMANGLAPIRTDFNLIASEYRPLLPKGKIATKHF